MSPLVYNPLHAVLWQGAWFAAVLGAGSGLFWLGPAALALALPDGWCPVAAIALVWAVALPLAVVIAGPRQPRSAPCPC